MNISLSNITLVCGSCGSLITKNHVKRTVYSLGRSLWSVGLSAGVRSSETSVWRHRMWLSVSVSHAITEQRVPPSRHSRTGRQCHWKNNDLSSSTFKFSAGECSHRNQKGLGALHWLLLTSYGELEMEQKPLWRCKIVGNRQQFACEREINKIWSRITFRPPALSFCDCVLDHCRNSNRSHFSPVRHYKSDGVLEMVRQFDLTSPHSWKTFACNGSLCTFHKALY